MNIYFLVIRGFWLLALDSGLLADARRAATEAVMIDNHGRRHQVLGYRTPMQVHGTTRRRPIRAA
jgi:hypothetical protein